MTNHEIHVANRRKTLLDFIRFWSGDFFLSTPTIREELSNVYSSDRTVRRDIDWLHKHKHILIDHSWTAHGTQRRYLRCGPKPYDLDY